MKHTRAQQIYCIVYTFHVHTSCFTNEGFQLELFKSLKIAAQ